MNATAAATLKPLSILLACAALSPVWAAPDEIALRRCRALPDSAARLACYDGTLDAAPAGAVPAQPPAQTRPIAAAPAAAPPTAAESFGLARRSDEPDAIVSSIRGRFEGWGPRSRIELANGQVWQVIDGSSASYYLLDPKVTVRRAVFGSFDLEIAGATRSPKVRRVE